MVIMKNIFSSFLKVLGWNTLAGSTQDLKSSGCKNTTKSTKILSSSRDTIYTKTNKMNKAFQWVKGDRIGEIVEWEGEIITEEGINFLVFQDGSRGNENLLGEFFIEISSVNEPLIDAEFMKPQDSQRILPREINPPIQRVETPLISNKIHPIATLLTDSKKTKTTINISLVAEIPPIDLMRVLADSYDDGQEQVLDYLSNTIDLDDIKKQIAKEIWLHAFKPRKNVKKNETA